MLKQKIKKLAELAIKIGLNVGKDDIVQIRVSVERNDLARELVREAYKAGAKKVIVDWVDDEKDLLDYTYQDEETLKNVPKHEYDKQESLLKSGVKQLFVSSNNPELLKDIDPNKIKEVSIAKSTKIKPLMNYRMNDIVSWTIISAPSTGWAKVVFPNSENPENDLWEAIFETTRVNKKDPVKSWEDNLELLSAKADWLNEMNFDSMHYTSSNGTNFTVGLPKGHIWRAAIAKNKKGERFVPNMPTEEVYTMPDRNRASGRLYSAKPLANNGNIIDEFWVEFKDGIVIDYDAKVGKEALKSILESDDDNSKRLGELALVPYDSPIQNSNILFFKTLFDENAASHVALGASYPTTLKGGQELTPEELISKGANQSIIHVDFMVGSKDLNVVGIKKDGTEVPVFINGNWA